MVKFKAKLHQDVPKNRMLQLYRPKDDTDTVYLKLAERTAGPEFVATRDLEKGEEVEVTVKDNTIWNVEAGEDIEAGIPVVSGPGGTVVRDIRGDDRQAYSVGYSINSAQKGEVVKIVRSYRTSPAWIRKVNDLLESSEK